MKKKVIYHSETDTTKAGRTIRALLAFLTANRYSLIFSLKLTLVKRNYEPNSFKRRAKENLYIFLVLFPLVMAITIMLQKCGNLPHNVPDPFRDKTEITTDSIDDETRHEVSRTRPQGCR